MMCFRYTILGALSLGLLLGGCSKKAATPDADELQRYVQENPDSVAESSDPTLLKDPGKVGE